MRVTPPPSFWYAVFRGGVRRYAVRKGSVRITQKSCYIVRRHTFLLKKRPIFIKKHNKRDIQSQITLNFRAFWGQKLAFTGRVPKFGRFILAISSVLQIIYQQICIKFGIKTGEPFSIRVMLNIRIIEIVTSGIYPYNPAPKQV